MNFIDLEAQLNIKLEGDKTLRNIIDLNISRVLNHTKFICGPEVNQLENDLAHFIDVKNCVAVSSGTDALLISLMALDINQGDEVITTPFSFISTVEVLLLLKAKPVFVDIDPKTFNIDPKKIEEKINENTKAIIPVSLYGQTADLKAINLIAEKYKIPVIEDAAQSFGAMHHNKFSCSQTTIATTSFFPSKPLGCYGDGGAIFTNNDSLADRVRRISKHGQTKRYIHSEIGINGRLDTIQAAILTPKLKLFEKEIFLRNEIAKRYENKFDKLGYSNSFYPFIENFNKSVFAQYTIRVKNRFKVQEFLKSKGIPTAIHYPCLLNEQEILSDSNTEKIKKNSENLIFAKEASKEVLSLPFSPYLKEIDQDLIVEKVHEANLMFNF